MQLVVDTSVIIAVILDEPEKAGLIAQTQEADLFAPLSISWEIGNAFSAMLKRQRMTLAQAKIALEIYREIPLSVLEIDLMEALELVNQFKIYAYDAYIIACALQQDCPLLSLASGLIYAAKAAGAQVLEVV